MKLTSLLGALAMAAGMVGALPAAWADAPVSSGFARIEVAKIIPVHYAPKHQVLVAIPIAVLPSANIRQGFAPIFVSGLLLGLPRDIKLGVIGGMVIVPDMTVLALTGLLFDLDGARLKLGASAFFTPQEQAVDAIGHVLAYVYKRELAVGAGVAAVGQFGVAETTAAGAGPTVQLVALRTEEKLLTVTAGVHFGRYPSLTQPGVVSWCEPRLSASYYF